MESLARNAFDNDLVPMEVVSRIQSLDPSIRWHPVVCRYLFFHVYATMQAPPSTTANPYKWWLTLLSDLKLSTVSDLVARIEKSESCMESILASRASPSGEGDLLHINDIPVLAKILSGRQFFKCWEQLVYSIPLRNGNISKLKTLEQLLKAWASRFPYPNVDLLEKTLHTLHSNKHCDAIEDLYIPELIFMPNQRYYGDTRRKQKSTRTRVYDKHGRIVDYGALSSILEKYPATLIEYAHFMLLPHTEAELLADVIRTMTPEECLNTVLTMWIKCEFHHARLPTFQSLVELLSEHEAAELMKCLLFEATQCQRFENGF